MDLPSPAPALSAYRQGSKLQATVTSDPCLYVQLSPPWDWFSSSGSGESRWKPIIFMVVIGPGMTNLSLIWVGAQNQHMDTRSHIWWELWALVWIYYQFPNCVYPMYLLSSGHIAQLTRRPLTCSRFLFRCLLILDAFLGPGCRSLHLPPTGPLLPAVSTWNAFIHVFVLLLKRTRRESKGFVYFVDLQYLGLLEQLGACNTCPVEMCGTKAGR